MPETEANRNALDTALTKLNNACHYLELSRPSKKDVKSASDAAKDAADILKASLVLLDHDCYSVQDPPQAPGTPLFKPSGEPTTAAAVPEPADLTLPTLGIIDVEIVSNGRSFKVGDKVRVIATGELGTVIEDDGDPEDVDPFKVEFEDGNYSPMSTSELEMVEAAPAAEVDEDAEAKAEIMNEPFPAGNKGARKKVYLERLDEMENVFSDAEDAEGRDNYQEQLKAFRPHRKAWTERWDVDPEAAWKALLAAIATATYAKRGEFSAWAPVAA